jgi:Lon protease-like protein
MTKAITRVPDGVLARLPLFPLPNVVLFPGMLVPLQVFEPRYLALVEHCLSDHRILAIPLLKPGFEADYEGSPPVYSTAGAGVISGHRHHADGTIAIVVRGIERVSLTAELPPQAAFRVARAERIIEVGGDDDLADEMPVLSMLLNNLGKALPQAALILNQIEAIAESTPELVDLLAAYLVGDPEQRQQLLSERDARARFTHLTQIVADMVLQIANDEMLH